MIVRKAVDDFSEHRGRLFAIAYRMVGSVADAEDLVQEAHRRREGRMHLTGPVRPIYWT